MLGGSLQDAVNVCLKQLNDFQLAIALARVVEGDSGPVLRNILTKIVVPLAFESGNRWLGSWAFWMLGRRDLSVRVLLVRNHPSVRSQGTEPCFRHLSSNSRLP